MTFSAVAVAPIIYYLDKIIHLVYGFITQSLVEKVMDKAESIDWKRELQQLVASADDKDRDAVEAFSKAIGPYLDNPELLRTLLGKIQRYSPEAVRIVTESHTIL